MFYILGFEHISFFLMVPLLKRGSRDINLCSKKLDVFLEFQICNLYCVVSLLRPCVGLFDEGPV